MKETKLMSMAILILAVSVFTGSIFISNAMKSNQSNLSGASAITEEGLMTQTEAAEYMSLDADQFENLVATLESQRIKLETYSTYSFIPYIVIDDALYFNKKQLDEWIEFNMTSRLEIDTLNENE